MGHHKKVAKKQKYTYPKKIFRYNVEITVDGEDLAGSEYTAIKGYYQSARKVKETLLSGMDVNDYKFREIDPVRAVKIKVRQTK